MTVRYGITIPFDGVTLLEHRDWFHRLADLGYTGVWSAEVDGADGFTPLTVAALSEERLNLGVAVTPTFTRGPGLLAMSIAAMAEVADGRFTMGLGASSQPVVERWNGIRYEKPYQRTRDVLRFVKRALDGEKIDEGLRDVRNSRLQAVAPRHQPATDLARGAAARHVAPRGRRSRRSDFELARRE
jgi:alkanesulfonate monooxygenase SsuD/methylene tetrahydromethanopterin reductase-like flavin-dependent oxidoreductase (luciferase family)